MRNVHCGLVNSGVNSSSCCVQEPLVICQAKHRRCYQFGSLLQCCQLICLLLKVTECKIGQAEEREC